MSKAKKIGFIFGALIICLCIAFSIGVYNESKTVNFGGTYSPFPSKRLKNECCHTVNMEGLSDLKAYGSGVIYFPDFKQYFKGNLKNLYVINLLNDELYYYKDRCLRWYGLGYMERDLGSLIFTHKPLKAAYKALMRVVYGTPPVHDLALLQTERQIIEELGGKYCLVQKGKGDWFNDKSFIGNMINFFESLPKDASLYIHCAHGRGRTTTYLVLYDIFRNAKKVSLKDIADRHYCLGREDVLNTELWTVGTWTQSALNARKDMVEKFYEYMTDPRGYDTQSWDQWGHERGVSNTHVVVHRKDENAPTL